MGTKLSHIQFINRAMKVHGSRYIYLTEYKLSSSSIVVACREHGIFLPTPVAHMNGSGCPTCGTIKAHDGFMLSNTEFIKRAELKHGKRYNYSKLNYKGAKKTVVIICENHGEFKQAAYSHLNGKGCTRCNKGEKWNTKLFILAANKVHNDRYDYKETVYINQRTPVSIICNTHGVFKQNTYSHIKASHGCPKCKTSKGESEIRDYLKENKIFFIEQKKFNGCIYKRKMAFDFFIPELNLCIEYDGQQHFKPFYMFRKCARGEAILKIIKEKDQIKDEWCEKNKINLLRIPYFKDTISTLKNYLNDKRVNTKVA